MSILPCNVHLPAKALGLLWECICCSGCSSSSVGLFGPLPYVSETKACLLSFSMSEELWEGVREVGRVDQHTVNYVGFTSYLPLREKWPSPRSNSTMPCCRFFHGYVMTSSLMQQDLNRIKPQIKLQGAPVELCSQSWGRVKFRLRLPSEFLMHVWITQAIIRHSAYNRILDNASERYTLIPPFDSLAADRHAHNVHVCLYFPLKGTATQVIHIRASTNSIRKWAASLYSALSQLTPFSTAAMLHDAPCSTQQQQTNLNPTAVTTLY